MQPKHNNKLFAKVLLVGVFIAILSYLFHPEVGHLSIMINDKPVVEPLARFAAIPIFLAIMGACCYPHDIAVYGYQRVSVFRHTVFCIHGLLDNSALFLASASDYSSGNRIDVFWP